MAIRSDHEKSTDELRLELGRERTQREESEKAAKELVWGLALAAVALTLALWRLSYEGRNGWQPWEWLLVLIVAGIGALFGTFVFWELGKACRWGYEGLAAALSPFVERILARWDKDGV